MQPEVNAAKQKLLDELQVEALQSSIIKVKALMDQNNSGKNTPTQRGNSIR